MYLVISDKMPIFFQADFIKCLPSKSFIESAEAIDTTEALSLNTESLSSDAPVPSFPMYHIRY